MNTFVSIFYGFALCFQYLWSLVSENSKWKIPEMVYQFQIVYHVEQCDAFSLCLAMGVNHSVCSYPFSNHLRRLTVVLSQGLLVGFGPSFSFRCRLWRKWELCRLSQSLWELLCSMYIQCVGDCTLLTHETQMVNDVLSYQNIPTNHLYLRHITNTTSSVKLLNEQLFVMISV